ncbi:CDP-alcohol phosphatidyltransferase family protein [Henriciella litoralis]|uniref:CDP-alcohol phosphatidyltransferase family protein n=1 Tax=Henriciella litoralis TaxID=568102 RepID=UPI000A04DB79|nr:CDP-alcohol phosphatidyltransferase family protein [Henriciella litoralis]
MTNELLDIRRPIKSRNSGWAVQAAKWLAARRVTPNQISVASMGFAALGGLAFCLVPHIDGALRVFLLLVAIAGVQGRLLCNLFDGMVAVEHGAGGKDGPFWNEFPDRVSDFLLLTGAGIACGLPWLGLVAAALAIFVAYVRELGRANALPADFGGPMAKQHRMGVLTGACALAIFEPLWSSHDILLPAALGVISLGAVLTIFLRSRRLVAGLKSQ